MTRTGFDADTVADAVTQPPFSAVTARGDRLLRRRRIRASALAVAVAALVGVAMTRSATGWNTEPPAADADRTYSSGSVFTDTVLADSGTIVMVKRNACAAVFSVSTDAGRTWSAYRGPVSWRECGIPVSTAYEVLSPTTFAATVDGVRYLSRDAAATWQSGEDGFTIVDAVPDGAVPRASGALQAIDPATGAAYQVLRTSTVTTVVNARFATDGALWVVGRSSNVAGFSPDAQAQVIVSTDRGRTWAQAGTIPSIGADPLVVPISARQAFVLGALNGQGAVYRTDDGGGTWTPAAAGWAVLTAATLNHAGQLMVYGGKRNGDRFIWTGDSGGTFTAVPVTESGFTTAGHVADAIWLATPKGVVAVTHDGHTWQRTAARS